MATGNEELAQFKTEINLCDYAEAQGFVLDRKQSSKSSAIMRHSNGDKIVIAKKPTGHWIYFNVHGNDNGSIIDFVKSQKSMSLGQVRKELRPWVNGGGVNYSVSKKRLPSQQETYNLLPAKQDFLRVNRSWVRSRSLLTTDRYLPSRGIPKSITNDPIFNDRIRVDNRQNCIFPHWNLSGELSGFEIKNKGFTGFSPGGEKGLWCSRPRVSDQIMVVCETAIDALSIAAIFGTDRKRFFSTAGKCGPHQIDSLISATSKMPEQSTVWLAFDNDPSGKEMARELRDILPRQSSGLVVIDKLPERSGQDWNDVLRTQLGTLDQNKICSDYHLSEFNH